MRPRVSSVCRISSLNAVEVAGKSVAHDVGDCAVPDELVRVDLLPVELPSPIRLASDVLHEPRDGARLPHRYVDLAGFVVPLAAGLRDPAPRAPRVQRHGA